VERERGEIVAEKNWEKLIFCLLWPLILSRLGLQSSTPFAKWSLAANCFNIALN